MATRPAPLPPSLSSGPFTVAAAAGAGLTRARLRAGDLVTPTYGVRDWPAASETLPARALAFSVALPDDVAFSHLTAARLLGLPTPRRWTPEEPLDVMRRTDLPRVERGGVRPHRGLERRWTARTAEGLVVTGAVHTWADLSPALALDDLVAVGDALLRKPHWIPAKELERAACDRDGRGAVRLREALALVRPGSRSAWESKARVAFHQWGLPEPELNVDVFSEAGVWLACPDFVWRRQRVIGEYDGDQHRTDRAAWQYERER